MTAFISGGIKMFIVVQNRNISVSDINIWSGFFVTLNGIDFPNADWDDISTSVLEIWGQKVLEQIPQERGSFKLYFMDGPYYLLCDRRDDKVIIQGIDAHHPQCLKLIATQSFPFAELAKGISCAISRMEYIAKQNAVTQYDFSTLQNIRSGLDRIWKT